jgi:hypothetical protein
MSGPEVTSLGSQVTATITAAARTMYPHDALPDEVYARVADRLVEAAAGSAEIVRTIEEGVAVLNDDRVFAALPADLQLEALEELEDTDFFELVRSTAVVEVYNDERTWELVGYEGPSFDKGGYIDRGFDDLDWLPDPEDVA